MIKKAKHAGGWHAIFYVLRMGWRVGFWRLWQSMMSKNSCKTCALGMGGQKGGMRNELGRWPEVCKKSIQAMSSDMQEGITEDFFENFSIAQLQAFSPRELETSGRLVRPLYAAKGDTHFRYLSWQEAVEKISRRLRATQPERSFFYLSGRSSNEAGFLLQLFARVYGTNHVNNCSYYCHQASGVGLGLSLGTGTATLDLHDVEKADLFFLMGSNPASNHPRLMTMLKDLRRRGGHVVVVNPLVEVGLKAFRVPSDARSLLFGTRIASHYLQIKTQGDIALLSGIGKSLLTTGAHDKEFIDHYTAGFNAYKTFLENLSWSEIVRDSGIDEEKIREIARLYSQAKRVVFGWCMGITHHEHGVANVQNIVNLALMRGMIGREGAGLLPIRGHSNVQGMGTMAVTPELKRVVFDRLTARGFTLPTHKGMDTLACLEASLQNKMDMAFCLGGNLYGATPDAKFASAAFSKLKMVAYASTTLNTGHASGLAEETLILPVLARDEEPQKTTQESMFNYVRLSDGGIRRHADLKSESYLIATIADLTLRDTNSLDWKKFYEHRHIRELIAEVIPGMEDLRDIDRTKKEFVIKDRVLHRPRFATADGKAKFTVTGLPKVHSDSEREFNLISLRSEGQFNTVVYEDFDYYRGQERRDVVLMNIEDMQRLHLQKDQRVRVKSHVGYMENILVRPFAVREGSVVMYYPEVNRVIPRYADTLAKTPAFKSARVEISAMQE